MRGVLIVCLLLSGCGGSPWKSVEPSGIAAVDETGVFVRWCVDEARDHGFDTPRSILQWMCSTSGSATLTPPLPEYEPDMAAAYTGPRPSPDVPWRCAKRMRSPRYEIVVQADDTDGRIIAAVFDNEGEGFGPIHVWEWAID